MSVFGKYGVGGSNPGKFPTPPDDNSGGFTLEVALIGTDAGQPDSKPEVSATAFGAPEHNKAT
jgi:hypothetical protein